MIDVKGTRSAASTAERADRYELSDGRRVSRVPEALGLALAGLALYLRSFLPGGSWSAHAAEPSRRQSDAPADAPAEEPAFGAPRGRRPEAGSATDRKAQPEASDEGPADAAAWRPMVTLGASVPRRGRVTGRRKAPGRSILPMSAQRRP